MLELRVVKNSTLLLRQYMAAHYSNPKGFVGRNICFEVAWSNLVFGYIVAGSATLHLPGRDDFFGITQANKKSHVQRIINNTFYHVERNHAGKYPVRNFTVKALKLFRLLAMSEWCKKYGEMPIGFESLIELPRTGEIYKRDGWKEVGLTKGYTCKRAAGKGSDRWSGKRVWDTKNLRPKRVFVRHI